MNRRSIRMGLALMLSLALSSCSKHAKHDSSPALPVIAPGSIELLEVKAQGQDAELVLPGRARASEEVTLSSNRGGRLTQLPRREGERFSRGETLAVFDSPEAAEAIRASRERLTAANTVLTQAKRQAARFDSLFAERVASARELEAVEAELREAQANHAQVTATLRDLERQLRLIAPFDGVVVRTAVDVGSDVSPGAPILQIRSSAGREVVVAVPESELDRLQSGTVSLQLASGRWIPARVVRTEGMTDPSTRTRETYVEATDAGVSPEPGAFVRVRWTGPGNATAESSPLVIPSTCVVARGALRGVYIQSDESMVLRWIRLGAQADGMVEVLSGLAPGDVIAQDGSLCHERATQGITR